jgi:DNA polymerase-3 subunit epsilon
VVGEPVGYAVVDTETTGLLTGYRHRIAEIAVVHCDFDGQVTDEWSTLVNPDRDLGPQAIHGIRAVEVRKAPRFEQIAGELIERLRDRIVVAHNWPFDAMHLRAEFERMHIVDTPLTADAGLCTMRTASTVLPHSGRSLIDCCAAAGLTGMRWHTARDDAMAAAMLLAYILRRDRNAAQFTSAQLHTAAWAWPRLPIGRVRPVHRLPADHVEPHFLARVVERLPRDEEPVVDAYFAMLDGALLDRQISASESDALIEVASRLGLGRADAISVHHTYLRELARAAWADNVLTDGERADMHTVAALLGLGDEIVDQVLVEERHSAGGSVAVGGLTLRPGDRIVMTGAMQRQRAEIKTLAVAAGLRATTGVSGQTAVLVAADPDSLSGKAKDARALGVPIVGEEAFLHVLSGLHVQNQPAASLG